jgi:hypothetical protein
VEERWRRALLENKHHLMGLIKAMMKPIVNAGIRAAKQVHRQQIVLIPNVFAEIECGGKQSCSSGKAWTLQEFEAMLQKQKKQQTLWRAGRRKMFPKFLMTFLLPPRVESFQLRWPRSAIFSNGARGHMHFVSKLPTMMPWETQTNCARSTFLKLATVRASGDAAKVRANKLATVGATGDFGATDLKKAHRSNWAHPCAAKQDG